MPGPSTACVLHPGDVALGRVGERFETLLGSCVSLILTDPRRTVASICHYVHAGSPPSGLLDDTRYAGAALDWMFRALRDEGIEPRLCQAYVYGGGNMFPWLVNGPHVGERNVRWIETALASQRIQVLSQETGGTGYRRLKWTVGAEAPAVTLVAL